MRSSRRVHGDVARRGGSLGAETRQGSEAGVRGFGRGFRVRSASRRPQGAPPDAGTRRHARAASLVGLALARRSHLRQEPESVRHLLGLRRARRSRVEDPDPGIDHERLFRGQRRRLQPVRHLLQQRRQRVDDDELPLASRHGGRELQSIPRRMPDSRLRQPGLRLRPAHHRMAHHPERRHRHQGSGDGLRPGLHRDVRELPGLQHVQRQHLPHLHGHRGAEPRRAHRRLGRRDVRRRRRLDREELVGHELGRVRLLLYPVRQRADRHRRFRVHRQQALRREREDLSLRRMGMVVVGGLGRRRRLRHGRLHAVRRSRRGGVAPRGRFLGDMGADELHHRDIRYVERLHPFEPSRRAVHGDEDGGGILHLHSSGPAHRPERRSHIH